MSDVAVEQDIQDLRAAVLQVTHMLANLKMSVDAYLSQRLAADALHQVRSLVEELEDSMVELSEKQLQLVLDKLERARYLVEQRKAKRRDG